MSDTYGDSGNRWWVGLQVSENINWTTSFSAPSGYEAFPSGDLVDDKAIVKAGVGGNVSLHDINWLIAGGPYTSKAKANAAIPGIQATNPAPGFGQQITGVNFSDVSHALSGFYNMITDGKRWRSIGWILLGIVLIIVGVTLWIKGSLLPNFSNVSKAAESAETVAEDPIAKAQGQAIEANKGFDKKRDAFLAKLPINED